MATDSLEYQPGMAAPQEARMLAPLVGEHQVQNIQEPLVNLVGSLANWYGEAKDKELEKAKLDIAANSGKHTHEQESNWLLNKADLTNLEISASSQTWGAQHLIDVKQFEALDPAEYQAHLASEAKVLTEGSANPEWMATRVNKEREELGQAHAVAHAQYNAVKGVETIANMYGTIIAKGKEQIARDPASAPAVHADIATKIGEILKDPARGHFAQLAFQKMETQQLKLADPMMYNLHELLVAKGIVHPDSHSQVFGLQEALTDYSNAMSTKIVQGVNLLEQQQNTGDSKAAAVTEAYVNDLITVASTSKLPLSDEAKVFIKAAASSAIHNPERVAAKAAQAKLEEVSKVHNEVDSLVTDITASEASGNRANTARLYRKSEELVARAKAAGWSEQEIDDLQVHTAAATSSAFDQGQMQQFDAHTKGIFEAMATSQSVDDFNHLSQLVAQAYTNTTIANPDLRKAVQETARHKVADLTLQRLKAMAAEGPEIEDTEGPAAAAQHVTKMKELLIGNNALTASAEKVWVATAQKLLNSYNKEGMPKLAARMADLVRDYKSNYAIGTGEYDFSPMTKGNRLLEERAAKSLPMFKRVAEEVGISLPLLMRLAKQESELEHFDASGKAKKGRGPDGRPTSATGLMQMINETAASMEGQPEPLDRARFETDPEYNLRRGAYHLKHLINTYGDVRSALMHYKGYSGGKGKYDNEAAPYADSILNSLPKETRNLSPASDASFQSDIAAARVAARAPAAIQKRKQNMLEMAGPLEELTGAPKGSTESSYYQHLVPAERQGEWNPKAPDAMDEAERLGAPRAALEQAYELIWRNPRLKGSASEVNPWSKIATTTAAVDNWEISEPLPDEIQTGSTAPQVIENKLLPKQREVVLPMWKQGLYDLAVKQIKAWGGGPILQEIVDEYIRRSDQGGPPEAMSNAIKEVYRPVKVGNTYRTVVDRSAPEAALNRKAAALIKAVAGGKMEYKGSGNRDMLSTKYFVNNKKADSKEYLANQAMYKGTHPSNQGLFLTLFNQAGNYAESPEIQLQLAAQALEHTQYQTANGIRFTNLTDLGNEAKTVNRHGIQSPDEILTDYRVQEWLMRPETGIIQNHEAAQERFVGTNYIWNYDAITKDLVGVPYNETGDVIRMPKAVWKVALTNESLPWNENPVGRALINGLIHSPFGHTLVTGKPW